MEPIRWGILGTGRIAGTLAKAIRFVPQAELYAVASRNLQKARAFQQEVGAGRAYGSYEELAGDPQVDVLYVATPHSRHAEDAALCLRAGKHVLCEKPLTVNAAQSRHLFELAEAQKVFLMEAMWMKFLPAIRKAMEWSSDGSIGRVSMIEAGFCNKAPYDPADRLFNPALAGGSLLDVGIYPLTLISLILGMHPEKVLSMSHLGATGVDEEAAVLLGYPGGALAYASSAIGTPGPNDARIYGTEGSLRIPDFWMAQRVELQAGERREVFEEPFGCNGYEYEVREVCGCLLAGKNRSSLAPAEDTVAVMELMDSVRAQWGLRYPGES